MALPPPDERFATTYAVIVIGESSMDFATIGVDLKTALEIAANGQDNLSYKYVVIEGRVYVPTSEED